MKTRGSPATRQMLVHYGTYSNLPNTPQEDQPSIEVDTVPDVGCRVDLCLFGLRDRRNCFSSPSLLGGVSQIVSDISMNGGQRGFNLPAVATIAGGSKSDLHEGKHFASDSANIMSARQQCLRLTAHELESQETIYALADAKVVCCNTGMIRNRIAGTEL